jgi:polysaccharide export outer membrane protein
MENQNKLKFFIVDDDHFSRMLYRQHLMNLGYKNNVLFDNGYDCIKKLDLSPDVIFLDYDMQPLNGLDVLQIIRQYNPNIRLLIISGNESKEIENDAKKFGAYEYIKKGDRDLEMISRVLSRIGKELN